MTPTDWTQHNGSECPVAPGTLVEVQPKFGRAYTTHAGRLNWSNNSAVGGIVAYRVLSILEAYVKATAPASYIVVDATGCEYVCEDREQAGKLAKQTFASALAADKVEIVRLTEELRLANLAYDGTADHMHAFRHKAETAESQLAALKVERDGLRVALKPFSDAVYNDNGDVTISGVDTRDYMLARKAYEASKERT